MKRSIVALSLVLAFAGEVMAQDGDILQIQSQSRQVSRTPDGDRNYYGLLYKDRMANWEKVDQPRFSSAEDSLRKYSDFVRLYSEVYSAYRQKDYQTAAVCGDSALLTGFDSPDLYFYLASSYEQLGDYEQAEHGYKLARKSGHPAGRLALAEFKKRQKARRKQAGGIGH